ncbi:MAG: HD-GYP domain-containing protein [Actinobacteria bacterium]|nr:HD-GYP domain-containing protein [Actinomycetota bacterium]
MRERLLWTYAGLLTVVALLGGVLVLPGWLAVDPWPIAALVVVTLVLSNMALELPFAVSLSLTFAPIFAGILIAGPLGGAVTGLASAVSLQEIREHKPAVLMLTNASQLFISGLLSGWVLVLLGGGALQTSASGSSLVGRIAGPIVAVTLFFVLNLLFVGVHVGLKTSMNASQVLRALAPGSYWASLLVLALLGYVMAHLIAMSSWLGVVLLVLPFMAARRTFRVYAELTEAYTSTVRSLVTAIEAKDPYTRGHSERVAVYARRLAEAIALQRSEADLLERAALLHDVGKIGVALDTLTSPAQLSAEEVRLIRQHPIIGSELVEDVEFLADIVPIVRHHHERYDGAGYPDGLVGDQIPQLARILAVADAYDAMTSDRAYRPGMTQVQALVEIARVAGTQLDRELALQFTAVVAVDQGAAV